ncbi:uncharacterized protein DEA37_0013148 [Paragonimus westermani]|uniref:Ig-like domain-containing protein n=1 Tax=Paragonimus westermani TaxID=34504 RepID=A0A5J4P1I9_9TREM|nr:uncharacterized protein DEA37_0013148 [Paragonimus westermani]
MAMQGGGEVNYQTYPQQPVHLGSSPASSTKVVNLSRAQINLGQPASPQQQQYQQQQPPQQRQQQTYYAQPAQYPSPPQASPFQPPPPQLQTYQAVQRSSPGQPQVFTVGSSQPIQQQPQQQVPQYRVLTTQQPSVEPTRTVIYGAGQPGTPSAYGNQTSVIYFGQQQQPQPLQQQPTAQSHTTFQQPQSQYQQYHQPSQQQQYPTQPQLTGQFVYAQPARPEQPAQQQPSSQPVRYQTQTSLRDGQPVTYPAANQQPASIRPISVQSSQTWAAPSQGAFDLPPPPSPQQQQQQYRSFGTTGVTTQSQPLSQASVTQFGQSPTRIQQTTGSYQSQQPQSPSQFRSSVDQTTYIKSQQELPVQAYRQPEYQSRPPVSPSQQDSQFARRRLPSTGAPTRSVKVKSLPMRTSSSMDNIDASGPPQFVQQPQQQLNVNEGEPVTVSARVRPAGDSSLRVEWFKNGKPLSASSRFTTIFDRGYAVLEFIYTNEDDTGDYSCVATNNAGQDQSTGCRITVIPEEGVVTDSQLPEESMIASLAAMENQMVQNGLARGARYRDEPKSTRPPQFMKPLNPQIGVREATQAHFETIVEPANDASLTVEWYKDGKPVSMGCRFNSILDRGFAILEILYCYPEDNGAYWCIAKNAAGQVQSNVVELHYDRPNIVEEETPAAPSFDILPVALTVTEGSPARFLVKAGGFPRPKVQWYIDGELMASQGGGGNWRVFQDGGISYLEFHRVGSPCQQHIQVVARNNLGEISADTTLVIEPQLDFRPDLRHVEPENPFRKLAQLKKVDRTTELVSAFNRSRPKALDLRRMERESEYKARSVAESEAMEAENLYARVQSQLRTSRRASQPPPTPPPTRTVVPQPVQQPAQVRPVPQMQAPPRPPPAPAPVAMAPPPPPPPPPMQPMMNAGMANQVIVPAHQAQSELMHDEVSADFTIEL